MLLYRKPETYFFHNAEYLTLISFKNDGKKYIIYKVFCSDKNEYKFGLIIVVPETDKFFNHHGINGTEAGDI